jgi:protein-tyrosine phosphatase
MPQTVSDNDLEAADLIVAVKRAEHHPLLMENFPNWVERVEFWHVDDLDCAGPEEAIPCLERLVSELIERLAAEART